MNRYDECWIEYHSAEWGRLADAGWITATVETMSSGMRLARMLRCWERR